MTNPAERERERSPPRMHTGAVVSQAAQMTARVTDTLRTPDIPHPAYHETVQHASQSGIERHCECEQPSVERGVRTSWGELCRTRAAPNQACAGRQAADDGAVPLRAVRGALFEGPMHTSRIHPTPGGRTSRPRAKSEFEGHSGWMQAAGPAHRLQAAIRLLDIAGFAGIALAAAASNEKMRGHASASRSPLGLYRQPVVSIL
ncbi:hypothetical protein CERSUDRAFT_77389 [Gelatoporia subvermispora B]|uniref:Uncharacterized protein n=1 Tax=Ceriporiopsis subvermispora (strain B) TaxID=914234 RepID=M2Q6A5_CERS8|nr:hypothetical protein CERSUDRAFT_77389 [Gelatoporia subvermispora B]